MNTNLVRKALPRAIFHAVLGILIIFLIYNLSRPVALIIIACGTTAFLAVDVARLQVPGLKSLFSRCLALFLRQKEENRLTGCSYFLLGCLITVLVFPKEIAIAAILFLSVGDPAAGIIKRWKGRIWIGSKSLEGNIACLVVCLLVAVFIIVVSGQPAAGVVIAGAIFAAVIQGLPLPINDNLTIPIFSGLIMLGFSALLT